MRFCSLEVSGVQRLLLPQAPRELLMQSALGFRASFLVRRRTNVSWLALAVPTLSRKGIRRRTLSSVAQSPRFFPLGRRSGFSESALLQRRRLPASAFCEVMSAIVRFTLEFCDSLDSV